MAALFNIIYKCKFCKNNEDSVLSDLIAFSIQNDE